jgi:Mn-containing catalase
VTNASGYPFTGAYIETTGDLAADILSDISAEQRAKVVYQNLYRQINDKGVREAIDFLLNREEAHNTCSGRPLICWRKPALLRMGVTEDSKQYFNLSTPVSSLIKTTSLIPDRLSSTFPISRLNT